MPQTINSLLSSPPYEGGERLATAGQVGVIRPSALQ